MLSGFIQALNVVKDACGIPPAQIDFGSACILPTAIKGRSLLFLGSGLSVHVHPEHDEQQGWLDRPLTVLH